MARGAARRSPCAHGPAERSADALRGGATGVRARARPPGAARLLAQDWRAALGRGRSRACRRGCFERRPRTARTRWPRDRAGAVVPGNRAARVSRRRQRRAPSTWAERALAEAAAGRGRRRRRARAGDRDDARRRTTRSGVALARTGRLGEAVDAYRAEHRARRGVTACCTRPVAATRTSACSTARSIRAGASRRACAASRPRRRSAISASSRGLYANLAVAYCALTDRCEAEGIEAAQAAIDLDRRLGLLDHLAVPLIVLGQIHQCHGERREAFAMYEEALGLAEAAGEPQLLFPCYDGLATLYLDTGDQAMAERYLTKAQDVCTRRRRAGRADGAAVPVLNPDGRNAP